VGAAALAGEQLFLAAFAVAMVLLAVRAFRKTLE
jgi:hypothetical protein